MSHIYLAAPLFSLAEQNFNFELAEYLRQEGFTVFLPQAECSGKVDRDIYTTCLGGLASAVLVVAVLDGADADSGTCWECGYAVAKGIPVIGVRSDFRGSGDIRGFNAMLYHSASAIVEGSEHLFPRLVQAIRELQSLN
ncbi:MAG: nucleoside 2-deoxyribosyltransferase [Pseudanabaenaceae cyanobacterium]